MKVNCLRPDQAMIASNCLRPASNSELSSVILRNIGATGMWSSLAMIGNYEGLNTVPLR